VLGRRSGTLGVVIGLALVTLIAPSLAQAELAPFGHACKRQYGVKFCPTETLGQRVPSFDKVPLDVDVTLPPTGTGPFPTIVALHGWGEGNSKKSYEATTPEAEGGLGYHNNNIYYAEHGYAFVTYSARGWDNSCGTEESRKNTPACKQGWTHLADERYEARDTQYLLGLLVDEKIATAGALGVTGFSYGAGQTVELAYLKNRIRLPNGNFAPWSTPRGKPLSIKAAFALAPWADLVSALVPNGRFNSGEVPPFGQSYEPMGVELLSYVNGLYALANTGAAYLAPPGEAPEADLTGWNALIGAGEPYETPEDEAIAHQIYTYHGALGIPLSGKPAPMLLASGWTDGLFPVEQSQRIYDQVRAVKGYVAAMLGDAGHPPADNKTNTFRALAEAGGPFFAAKLKHEGTTLNNGSVTAYTQTCPLSAPGGGPLSDRDGPS
jgi:X-Pro dipeptidyl-peptidase (S15 family)